MAPYVTYFRDTILYKHHVTTRENPSLKIKWNQIKSLKEREAPTGYSRFFRLPWTNIDQRELKKPNELINKTDIQVLLYKTRLVIFLHKYRTESLKKSKPITLIKQITITVQDPGFRGLRTNIDQSELQKQTSWLNKIDIQVLFNKTWLVIFLVINTKNEASLLHKLIPNNCSRPGSGSGFRGPRAEINQRELKKPNELINKTVIKVFYKIRLMNIINWTDYHNCWRPGF